MISGRVISIGDVHGCPAELQKLLDLTAPTPNDLVILVGDLVNRGPDSHAVIEIARRYRAISLLGNHEARLLAFHHTGDASLLREDDQRTVGQLTDDDWSYLAAMPLHHHIQELDTVFVHGGFLPDMPWSSQPASVVTRIQVIDKDGKPRKRADAPNAPYWADLWKGPPFVVYGHTPRTQVYWLQWSIGIDTACAMGGCLTAFILPEKKVVQVPALKKYY